LLFTAHNGVGSDAAQSFTLTVNQAPAITSGPSAAFTEAVASTFTVTATGTPAPTLTLSGDALPAGVTFTAATGILGGTPVSGIAGIYHLVITASNGVGSPATQNFTVVVSPAGFAYDPATRNLTITASAPQNSVSISQSTTQDAAGNLHTVYTF